MKLDFAMRKKILSFALLGALMVLPSCSWGMTTDKKVTDFPIEARQRMARTQTYRGIWGVNIGFDILILQFDPSGKGVLTGGGGLFQAIFNWVADDKNEISCVLDTEYLDVEALWELPKERQKFTVRYLPESNKMQVGNDELFGQYEKSRSLPFVSAEPRVQDIIKMFEKARQQEEAERQKYWNDKICKTATKRCENLEVLLEMLAKETNCVSRIIDVKTGVRGLTDRFLFENDMFGGFCVELEFARVDVGKQPKNLDERMLLPEMKTPRPTSFPPPRVTYKNGIDAVKKSWKDFSPKDNIASAVLRSGNWRACKDVIILLWTPDEGKEKEVLKALEERFKGRFPCDVDILTIRKKPDPVK